MINSNKLELRLALIEQRLATLESVATNLLPAMHNTIGQMIVQIVALNEAVKELQDAGSGDEWKYGRGEPFD